MKTISAASSLFDFTLLWLGGNMHPSALALPRCWDGLLDWTEDATLTTALLRQSNLCRIENRKKGSDASGERARQSGSGIISPRFTPFTLKDESEMLAKLPEMTWMQRASFLSENVSLSSIVIENGFSLYLNGY
jgi:hypothetical protein